MRLQYIEPCKRVVEDDPHRRGRGCGIGTLEACDAGTNQGILPATSHCSSQSGGMVLDAAEFRLEDSRNLEEITFFCLEAGKLVIFYNSHRAVCFQIFQVNVHAWIFP